jgi:hypothetical protein
MTISVYGVRLNIGFFPMAVFSGTMGLNPGIALNR